MADNRQTQNWLSRLAAKARKKLYYESVRCAGAWQTQFRASHINT